MKAVISVQDKFISVQDKKTISNKIFSQIIF